MILVYEIDTDKFVTINTKNLKIGFTKNIDKAAYWTNKRKAKTWNRAIKYKFPNATLREVGFVLK